jgi:EmrB/QacA subfamily drug resistance transporter
MTPQTQNPHHARRWAILAILGLAQLMVVLDATIVNIALPSAQKALHFTNDNRQWIVTAYSLAFGSLLLLGGKISDLFGRKWTFVVGLGGFAIASAVGGAATSFGMLAAARTLQGAFGALLAPAALSLLTTTFTETSERNKAFGIYGAIAGSGASVGLLLGGVLTQLLNWRFSMYVNLVFAVFAIAGALVLLHNVRPAKRPKIDLPGTVTVSAGLFALVYGFNHAQTTSWGNTMTIAILAAGVVLLGVFAAIERRVAHPLLPLRVVTDRNRGGAFLSMLLAAAAMFGVFLFLTYYLQQTRGYTPIQTGLAFLPMTVVIMITAVVATTRLRDRLGPRVLVFTGMLLGAAGMLILTGIGVGSSYATDILPALRVMGVGLGLVFSIAMNGATLGVQPSDAGVASATVNAAQQVGGSLGTALLSTLAASSAASFVTSAGVRPTPALLAHAAVHGYTFAFAISAAIFVAGAVIAGLLFEGRARQPQAVAEPDVVGEPDVEAEFQGEAREPVLVA